MKRKRRYPVTHLQTGELGWTLQGDQHVSGKIAVTFQNGEKRLVERSKLQKGHYTNVLKK